MHISIGRLKTIAELNTPEFHLNKPNRVDVPILIIDDEDVPNIEELKSHRYNITHTKDIDQIESTAPFEIIVCDIRGVGKKFGSKFEGAHIISEIRNFYPFKIINAYTAYTFDPSYNRFLKQADDVFKKDADIDEWVTLLENSIDLAINPVHKWRKISNYLQSRDIAMSDLALLEHQYVKLMQKKIKLDTFPGRKLNRNLSQENKDVIQSFLTSLIIKIIFGQL